MNPLNCQSIGRYRQSVCLGRRRKLDRDKPSWALGTTTQFCLWLNVRVLANINESDVSLTSKEPFWAQWKFIILPHTVEQGIPCNKNQILSSCFQSSHGFIMYLELNLYLYQSFRVLLNLSPCPDFLPLFSPTFSGFSLCWSLKTGQARAGLKPLPALPSPRYPSAKYQVSV